MKIQEYQVHGTSHDGQPFSLVDRFNEHQARSIGAVFHEDGLMLKDADTLLDLWNRMSRAQGNSLVYSHTDEQLERNLEEQRVIVAESHRLRQEAQDQCARRMSNAASVASGDAALRDRRWRLERIDKMTDEQLLESARQHAERIGQQEPDRPRMSG